MTATAVRPVSIDTKAFRFAVDDVAPVAIAAKGNSLLQHVRVRVQGGTMDVEAISTEAYALRSGPVVESEGIDLLLPAALLSSFVKSAPGSFVTIEPDDKGGARLSSGASKARLPGLDPEDFPVAPSWEGRTVICENASPFVAALKRVALCASHDPKDLHPYLRCVLLSESPAFASATDSKNFALAPIEGAVDGYWLLPAPFVAQLPEDGDFEMSKLSNGRYAARGAGWAKCFASLDNGGKHPPYRDKIRAFDPPVRFAALRSDVIGAVKRLSSFSQGGDVIRMRIEPTTEGLSLSLELQDDGRAASETVDAPICEGEGFSVDARRLLRALEPIEGDGVRCCYDGGKSPILIHGDDGVMTLVQPLVSA